MYLDTKYNLDGNVGEPKSILERAAKVPADNLPWTFTVCQSSLDEKTQHRRHLPLAPL